VSQSGCNCRHWFSEFAYVELTLPKVVASSSARGGGRPPKPKHLVNSCVLTGISCASTILRLRAANAREKLSLDELMFSGVDTLVERLRCENCFETRKVASRPEAMRLYRTGSQRTIQAVRRAEPVTYARKFLHHPHTDSKSGGYRGTLRLRRGEAMARDCQHLALGTQKAKAPFRICGTVLNGKYELTEFAVSGGTGTL
jgi:hypothetical protein